MPQTLARPPRKVRRTPVRIGPADHGRRMSLDDFANAIGQEGHTYELNKGVIEVSGIPDLPHGRQFQELRDQLTLHRVNHSGSIEYLGGGMEAKMLIAAVESERHPDLSVYTTPPPAGVRGAEVWAVWVPSIVVEFVSPRSGKRDYEDKPDEYLMSGVGEYWIVDGSQTRFTALARYRGQWRPKVLKQQKYATNPAARVHARPQAGVRRRMRRRVSRRLARAATCLAVVERRPRLEPVAVGAAEAERRPVPARQRAAVGQISPEAQE